MKKFALITFISIVLLFSCNTEEKPSLVYPEDGSNTQTEQELLKDTTLVVTGELPIYFDSTDYLLFPIGTLELSNRGGRLLYGSGTGDISFSSGYLNGISYSGSLDNIMIQHIEASDFRPLTDNILKIRGFHFLKALKKKTNMNLIVLEVTDKDTNRDGRLNDKDIESLFISEISGQGFKKLTPAFHELLNWKVLEVNNKLYFRTLEDSDRNGMFNNKDKIHHFYTALDDPQFQVIEYDPLN